MMASQFNVAGSSVIGVAAGGNVNISGDINIVYASPQVELEYEIFDLPRCITTFKGREKEMEELDHIFFNQHKQKLVICALPGFGKTELSKQYANRCVKNNNVHRAFWIKAEHRNDLQTSFKTLKKIYKTFSGKVCLFVFDNATSRSDVYEYEPPSDSENYLFLITSREKDWGNDIISFPLAPLSPESTIEIYKSFLNGNYREEDRSLYDKLAAVVSHVPLGIQITGAYIREQMIALGDDFDLGEYIEALEQSQEDILDVPIPSSSPNTYRNSIYGAVSISLKKIQNVKGTHTRKLALDILYICSYLDCEDIKFEDLIEMSKSKEVLKTNKNSKNEIKIALNLLSNFLFISYNSGDLYIKIHQLIQDIVRLYLQNCHTEIQSSCYTACLQYIFEIRNKFYYFSHCRYVLKYADHNASLINDFYKKHLSKSSEVLNKFLLSLIAWECSDSLNIIIEHDGTHNMKDITETILNLLMIYDLDVNKTDAQQLTPLHIATMFWNMNAINILTKCKANVNAKDFDGETTLFYFFRSACKRENVNMITVNNILELLQFEDNKIVTDNKGRNLLSLAAAFSNNTDLLNLLVQYGFEVNSTDELKATPTHMAALRYNTVALKFLLKHKPDLNARDCDGRTAVFNFIRGACKCEKINIVEINEILDLLEVENNIKTRDYNGQNLLFTAATFCRNTELLDLLVQRGFDVNSRDANKTTPTHIAAIVYNIVAIKCLLKHNPDLNARDNDGHTVSFHFIEGACKRENVNITEVNEILDLFEVENNKNTTNNMGQNLLFVAAALSTNTELLNLLVQRGFDINSKDVDQATPTHLAALEYNLIAIKFFVRLNADLNIKDSNGETALFYFIRGACSRDNTNIDEVKDILNLLQCKQNKDITTNNNNTLLYSAVASCHEELVSFLITEYEFNVNHKDLQGDTPLHEVIFSVDGDAPRSQEAVIRTVEVLKSHGADLNIRNNDGKTPLRIAEENGAKFLIPYLTEGIVFVENHFL